MVTTVNFPHDDFSFGLLSSSLCFILGMVGIIELCLGSLISFYGMSAILYPYEFQFFPFLLSFLIFSSRSILFIIFIKSEWRMWKGRWISLMFFHIFVFFFFTLNVCKMSTCLSWLSRKIYFGVFFLWISTYKLSIEIIKFFDDFSRFLRESMKHKVHLMKSFTCWTWGFFGWEKSIDFAHEVNFISWNWVG